MSKIYNMSIDSRWAWDSLITSTLLHSYKCTAWFWHRLSSSVSCCYHY